MASGATGAMNLLITFSLGVIIFAAIMMVGIVIVSGLGSGVGGQANAFAQNIINPINTQTNTYFPTVVLAVFLAAIIAVFGAGIYYLVKLSQGFGGNKRGGGFSE